MHRYCLLGISGPLTLAALSYGFTCITSRAGCRPTRRLLLPGAQCGRCRRLQAATGARRSPAAARRQRPASVARAERACCRRQHAGRPRDRPARVVRARRSGPGERSGRPEPRGASGGSGAAAGGMGPAGRCPTAAPVVTDAPGTHGGGTRVHLYTHICPGSTA